MRARIGLVLLLVAAPALFAQTTASLTGIITSGGRPMPGVIVTLRSDNAFSTDVALRSTLGRFFAQADILNIFGNDALFDPQRIGTTVSTAATSTALQPFDPRAQTPVTGVNYQLAANFAQALNNLAYQTPRTFRISVGARF